MTPAATIPFQPVPELPLPALGEREWLLDCHCARPVTDLLNGQGWDVVTDLDCNVHCSSPDRRMYVGFLPESREAARGELWHIHVTTRTALRLGIRPSVRTPRHRLSPDSSPP